MDNRDSIIWLTDNQVHFIEWLDYKYDNDDRLWVETHNKIIALLHDDPSLFDNRSWSELERLADGY